MDCCICTAHIARRVDNYIIRFYEHATLANVVQAIEAPWWTRPISGRAEKAIASSKAMWPFY